MLASKLSTLPVAIALAWLTPVPSYAERSATWTCAKWVDGREQHLSTTMETWVQGYLTSSNQWALALGGTVPCESRRY